MFLKNLGDNQMFSAIPDMLRYMAYLGWSDEDRDCLVEIAGAEAKCSRLMVRYRAKTGPNYDLVCGFDITDKMVQGHFWTYRRKRRPRVAGMSPVCRAFGSWNHLNRIIHHDTWQHNYEEGCVMAKFCGHVAPEQYKDDSDWFCEQRWTPICSPSSAGQKYSSIHARR